MRQRLLNFSSSNSLYPRGSSKGILELKQKRENTTTMKQILKVDKLLNEKQRPEPTMSITSSKAKPTDNKSDGPPDTDMDDTIKEEATFTQPKFKRSKTVSITR